MKFLADMNLSPFTVADLASDGIDIVRVSSLLPTNASDKEILDLARREERVVITHDTDPDLVTQRLRQALPKIETALSNGNAITIDDKSIRVRELPIR